MKEFITNKKYIRTIWYVYIILMITVLSKMVNVARIYAISSGEFIYAIAFYSFVLFAIIYAAIKLTKREAKSKLVISDSYIRVNKNKYSKQSIRLDEIKSIRQIYRGIIFIKVYRIESKNQSLIILINRYDKYKEAMHLIYEAVKDLDGVYIDEGFVCKKEKI